MGEGRETEYNYFVGLRNAFQEGLAATATSVSVARGKGGDARAIVNNAIKHAKRFDPDRNRGDRVFLLLDTEGPGRAPELPKAEELANKNGIEIIYSSPAFEYWFLCHFRPTARGYLKDCDAAITALNKIWLKFYTTQYSKTDRDIFDRLSERLDIAYDQALTTDIHHLSSGGVARGTNPSTQVYELISILLGVLSNKKCPITGIWKLTSDAEVTIQLNKGDKMPSRGKDAVNWHL